MLKKTLRTLKKKLLLQTRTGPKIFFLSLTLKFLNGKNNIALNNHKTLAKRYLIYISLYWSSSNQCYLKSIH